jgi:LmbE family N-acetylglucosaminyl deacetylase
VLPVEPEKLKSIYHMPSKLTGERVLVLAPHPDDETFGCGGSLALHVDAGDAVKVIILTDGRAGDFLNEHSDKDTYVKVRQNEVQQALSFLSVTDFHFLGVYDQELQKNFDRAAEALKEIFIEFKPTLVYAPALTEFHTDHKMANELLWFLVRETPSVECVALYEVDPPTSINCLVDITSVVEKKRSACNAYESQNRVYAYGEGALALNQFRASKCPKGVTHAEGFYFYRIEKQNK